MSSKRTDLSPPGLMIFTGNSHPRLASSIAFELGVPLGKANVARFSDGEVAVEIMENVRSQHVYLIQPTSPPAAENLMELLAMVDALKRASAASVRS